MKREESRWGLYSRNIANQSSLKGVSPARVSRLVNLVRNNFWVNEQRGLDEKKIYGGKINAMTGESVRIQAEIHSAIISMVKHWISCLRTVLRSMYRTYWIQRLPLPSNFPLLTRRELFDFLDELRDIWL